MNSSLKRFLPPAIVFAAAAYFGWSEGDSLLQEETIVRATAVRWKTEDLDPPTKPKITKNPFDSVLVASEEQEVEEETGKLIPATKPLGPDASEMVSGFQLRGIAQVGTIRWAIINGRSVKVGDVVETQNSYHHRCEIIAIEKDHIMLRCEETVVKIDAYKVAMAAQGNPATQPTFLSPETNPAEAAPDDAGPTDRPAALPAPLPS